MYKVNRVGTPNFFRHTSSNLTMAAPTLDDWNSVTNTAHVLNAAPGTGFDIVRTQSASTFNIADAKKFAYVIQFGVAKPARGNQLGLEIVGSLGLLAPGAWPIMPIWGQLSAAGAGAVQDAVTFSGPPIALRPDEVGFSSATKTWRESHIQTQVVLSEIEGHDLNATYAFGFQIYAQGAGADVGAVRANLAVRSIAIPADFRYYDPLRAN